MVFPRLSLAPLPTPGTPTGRNWEVLGNPRAPLGKGQKKSFPPQTQICGLRDQRRLGPASLAAPGRAAGRQPPGQKGSQSPRLPSSVSTEPLPEWVAPCVLGRACRLAELLLLSHTPHRDLGSLPSRGREEPTAPCPHSAGTLPLREPPPQGADSLLGFREVTGTDAWCGTSTSSLETRRHQLGKRAPCSLGG